MNPKQLDKYIKVQEDFITAETIILYAYKCLQKNSKDFFIYFQPGLNCDSSFIKLNWKDSMSLDIFDECMREFTHDMSTGKFSIHQTGLFNCLTNKVKGDKSASLDEILIFFKGVLTSDGI
jgi:hypothetical protein